MTTRKYLINIPDFTGIFMLSFLEWKEQSLSEDIKFAKGKDNDFFYDRKQLLTLKKGDKDQYRVEGRTAGLWSHAIKHLEEVRPEFVANVVKQIKNTLVDYVKSGKAPSDFEVRYFSTETTSKTKEPLKLINKAPQPAIINLLDLINDKAMQKKPLSEIEEKLVKHIKTLADEYARIIENHMKEAVNLDIARDTSTVMKLLNEAKTVSFYTSNQNQEMKVFLNFAERFIIITEPDGVHTGFQISDTQPNVKSVIGTFMSRFGRKMRFRNGNVYRAFSQFKK